MNFREIFRFVRNIDTLIHPSTKSVTQTSRCTSIGRALSVGRKQTDCASQDSLINITSLLASSRLGRSLADPLLKLDGFKPSSSNRRCRSQDQTRAPNAAAPRDARPRLSGDRARQECRFGCAAAGRFQIRARTARRAGTQKAKSIKRFKREHRS